MQFSFQGRTEVKVRKWRQISLTLSNETAAGAHEEESRRLLLPASRQPFVRIFMADLYVAGEDCEKLGALVRHRVEAGTSCAVTS